VCWNVEVKPQCELMIELQWLKRGIIEDEGFIRSVIIGVSQ
jgi:hypothetical protein